MPFEATRIVLYLVSDSRASIQEPSVLKICASERARDREENFSLEGREKVWYGLVLVEIDERGRYIGGWCLREGGIFGKVLCC